MHQNFRSTIHTIVHNMLFSFYYSYWYQLLLQDMFLCIIILIFICNWYMIANIK